MGFVSKIAYITFITGALCMLSTALSADVIRLSEPTAQDQDSETFGATLNTGLPKKSLATLLANSADNLGQPFLMQTRIAKVCQKKGCFFIAQQDQHVVRISFRDYGFFIPTDSSGKTVTLNGELIKKNMTPEQAQHFIADLSASSTITAGEVYEIVADSIVIPK